MWYRHRWLSFRPVSKYDLANKHKLYPARKVSVKISSKVLMAVRVLDKKKLHVEKTTF